MEDYVILINVMASLIDTNKELKDRVVDAMNIIHRYDKSIYYKAEIVNAGEILNEQDDKIKEMELKIAELEGEKVKWLNQLTSFV